MTDLWSYLVQPAVGVGASLGFVLGAVVGYLTPRKGQQ